MILDEKKRKFVEDWNQRYGGRHELKDQPAVMKLVEGLNEMAKHLATASSGLTATLQTNEQGVTQLVLDATPKTV